MISAYKLSSKLFSIKNFKILIFIKLYYKLASDNQPVLFLNSILFEQKSHLFYKHLIFFITLT